MSPAGCSALYSVATRAADWEAPLTTTRRNLQPAEDVAGIVATGGDPDRLGEDVVGEVVAGVAERAVARRVARGEPGLAAHSDVLGAHADDGVAVLQHGGDRRAGRQAVEPGRHVVPDDDEVPVEAPARRAFDEHPGAVWRGLRRRHAPAAVRAVLADEGVASRLTVEEPLLLRGAIGESVGDGAPRPAPEPGLDRPQLRHEKIPPICPDRQRMLFLPVRHQSHLEPSPAFPAEICHWRIAGRDAASGRAGSDSGEEHCTVDTACARIEKEIFRLRSACFR